MTLMNKDYGNVVDCFEYFYFVYIMVEFCILYTPKSDSLEFQLLFLLIVCNAFILVILAFSNFKICGASNLPLRKRSTTVQLLERNRRHSSSSKFRKFRMHRRRSGSEAGRKGIVSGDGVKTTKFQLQPCAVSQPRNFG